MFAASPPGLAGRTAIAARAVAKAVIFAAGFLTLLVVAGFVLVLTGVPGDPRLAAVVEGFITLAAALGAGWVMLLVVERKAPGALGFALSRGVPAELGRGLAIGTVMLAAVAAALMAGGLLRYRDEPGSVAGIVTTWVADLGTLALPAAAEEALFRGYGMQVLVNGLGAGPAIVATSLAFAAAHVGNPAVGSLALGNIFLAGVLLGAAYLRTGSLWFASALHLGWNWAMASLADLPVSGLTFLDTPVYDAVERGPAWLTGGAFGPEGGLIGTVAFLLGMALLRYAPRTRGPVPAWGAAAVPVAHADGVRAESGGE